MAIKQMKSSKNHKLHYFDFYPELASMDKWEIEKMASDINTPPEILDKFADEHDMYDYIMVNALSNPNCPLEALMRVAMYYNSCDFNDTVENNPFEAIAKNPNASSSLLSYIILVRHCCGDASIYYAQRNPNLSPEVAKMYENGWNWGRLILTCQEPKLLRSLAEFYKRYHRSLLKEIRKNPYADVETISFCSGAKSQNR